MKIALHIELRKTRGAESMAAMDHNSGDVNRCIVGVSTELTLVLINELVDEKLDLIFMGIFKVLGLLKEVSCWILKFLHLNFNII